ncbi:hypothetical protein J5X84_33985 [Streptosporangiaceae bacterium NEAU-GS5]|nr:hypothetical protein [Streptosporangiaceae bacterium NEAU-GS5]
MGSSGAGAGGGSGGGSGGFGGGRGGGGIGSVTLRGGALTSADPGAAAAFDAIVKVYAKLSHDYLSSLLSDPGVAKAYEALFHLSVALLQDRSWDAVQREFGVDDGPGCLTRFAAALASDGGSDAVNPRLQAPLKAAIRDFLLRAVGDDHAIRNRGNAEDVIAAANSGVFGRTANLFLGSYLSETLRLEAKNLNRATRAHLNDFAMAQANKIVGAFARKFRHQPWKDIPQVSYPHMIRVLGGEPDWTVKQLRATVTP